MIRLLDASPLRRRWAVVALFREATPVVGLHWFRCLAEDEARRRTLWYETWTGQRYAVRPVDRHGRVLTDQPEAAAHRVA